MSRGRRVDTLTLSSFSRGEDEFCLTTTFEDHPHGANMQSTILTRQLHRTACKEGKLPSTLFIGADNTPKETKNSTNVSWGIWLLASLRGTALREIQWQYPTHPRWARPVFFTAHLQLARPLLLHPQRDEGRFQAVLKSIQYELESPRILL